MFGVIAVSQGAITQVRVLGGLIGLAICTAVLIQSVTTRLSSVLAPEQLHSLLQSTTSIAQFSQAQAAATRSVYGDIFNLQMRVVMFFTVGSLIISIFTIRRHPRSLTQVHERQGETEALKREEAGINREEANVIIETERKLIK